MRGMDSDRPALAPAVEARTADEEIVDEARLRLARDSHFHRGEMISIESDCGVLCVRGRVPSYYLKQVVQSLLMEIDGVEQLVNDIDVVNIAGLSSVQRKGPHGDRVRK